MEIAPKILMYTNSITAKDRFHSGTETDESENDQDHMRHHIKHEKDGEELGE